MRIFGWDYPPGCSSVPGDEPDLPETCPTCGGKNANEDGDPVYPEDPAFCSWACSLVYDADQEVALRDEAAAMRELDALNDRREAE
jgi:endogenous inhibitor of DNA gyrase (YacG/DUF329 family)